MYRTPDRQIRILPYLKGKRKGKEAHRLERLSMTCPFLADAMEGFDTVTGDHVSAIKRLQTAVVGKTRSGRYTLRLWMSIAASFLLLAGAGLLLLPEKTPEQPAREDILADLPENFPVNEKEESPESEPVAPAIVSEPEPVARKTAKTAMSVNMEIRDMTEPSAVFPEEDDFNGVADISMTEISLSESRSVPKNKNDIQGIVTDEAGQPLPNAVLHAKSAPAGTVAGNGQSAMKIADSAVIVAGYAGYLHKEVKADTSPLAIAMQENPYLLEEVTVVAFGTQKRRTMTETVSVLSISTPSKPVAEKSPTPVIGKRAYKRYLERQRVRPGGACAEAKGEVEIRFDVDENGRPCDLTVVGSLCPDADREAIRLVTEGCNWIPGTTKATVKVRF
ncbi:MAG: hypothetical protein LBF89_10730 [Bacteroidales bacterium]|jgi:hypothetical protein|nr:hypothetical protein [Bacteroidales bacterium]